MFCRGSGGWSAPRETVAQKQKLPPVQLYNLAEDPKESKNVAKQNPEIVQELTKLLRDTIENGRSTPGPRQKNDGGSNHWPNVPWKKGATTAPPKAKGASKKPLTVETPVEGGRIKLPTPMQNIVRAWIPGKEPQFVNWSFNKDATEIHLLAKKTPVKLIAMEKSGRHDEGVIVFSALDSKVVGTKAQLETHPGNHRIGFWANGADYVTWDLKEKITAGKYDVELVYSRAGAAGAEAAVNIGDATLPVKLVPTGSWYIYQVQPIGSVELKASDSLRVEVKSTKQKGAVMNLKAVLLHPKS